MFQVALIVYSIMDDPLSVNLLTEMDQKMDLLLRSGSLMLVLPFLTRVRGTCSDAIVYVSTSLKTFSHTSPFEVAKRQVVLLLITHRTSALASPFDGLS